MGIREYEFRECLRGCEDGKEERREKRLVTMFWMNNFSVKPSLCIFRTPLENIETKRTPIHSLPIIAWFCESLGSVTILIPHRGISC